MILSKDNILFVCNYVCSYFACFLKEREKPPPDDLHGLRVHCWVLVLSGKREVPVSFFIDSSTGKTYPVDSEHYLGIESVWNHKNYWVNMQDCGQGLKVNVQSAT